MGRRDSRRSFTRTQKNEILFQQNNKCALCGKTLEAIDIEYDHKEPWSEEGRTITQNGRALCGSCHNKVTHKSRLEKVDNGKYPRLDDDEDEDEDDYEDEEEDDEDDDD